MVARASFQAAFPRAMKPLRVGSRKTLEPERRGPLNKPALVAAARSLKWHGHKLEQKAHPKKIKKNLQNLVSNSNTNGGGSVLQEHTIREVLNGEITVSFDLDERLKKSGHFFLWTLSFQPKKFHKVQVVAKNRDLYN